MDVSEPVWQMRSGFMSIIDGKYKADDAMKGPLGKKALTPLRGAANFDPTDPAV